MQLHAFIRCKGAEAAAAPLAQKEAEPGAAAEAAPGAVARTRRPARSAKAAASGTRPEAQPQPQPQADLSAQVAAAASTLPPELAELLKVLSLLLVARVQNCS